MSFLLAPEIPAPGFSFDNCRRNQVLQQAGYPIPEFRKTGTTIAGVVYKDGVVLGADTRATEKNLISDKNCEKIHYLADNMYCCGAGTAADTVMTTRTVSSQIQILGLHTGRAPSVASSMTLLKRMLFRYKGDISAALILGGVDLHGPHIYSIYPHGSTDELPYTTLGSGAYTAMGVFESKWRRNMSEKAAKALVRDAILAGIFSDLGSGSNVDLCVITKNGAEYIRRFDQPNVKGERQGRYRFKRGTTPVQRSRQIPLDIQYECSRRVVRGQPILEFQHELFSSTSSSHHQQPKRHYKLYL